MSGDLALPVAVLLNSFDDLLVTLAGIVQHALKEDRIERGSIGETLALGDLGDMVTFMEMVRVTVDKFVITQEDLAFDIRPDGILIDPPGDELTVFFNRLGLRPAELTEDPIRGQAGVGQFITRRGQVTGPFPVPRLLHHAGSDRVQDHVTANFQKMRIFLDNDRLVSALEEMAGPPAPVIEELGIDPVHLTHAEAEVPVRGLDEEMIVVVHQTVGVTKPVVALIGMLERPKEVFAVQIILEYGFLFVAARGHMIDCTWVFYAKGTSHEGKIAQGRYNGRVKHWRSDYRLMFVFPVSLRFL